MFTFLKILFFIMVCLFSFGLLGMDIPDDVVENDTYEVRLIQWERLGDKFEQHKYIFNIQNKVTREEFTIDVENLTKEIKEIKLIKDRLVVFGIVEKALASGITILDLKQKEEIDFILCYEPHLSPTGQYLVYKKFYPRFAPAEVRSDLVLIYNLEDSPKNNRVEEKYKDLREKSERIGDPEYIASGENVGYPVYPKENIKNQTYFVWSASQEERHSVADVFLWFDQHKKLLFVDKYAGENWLVSVDFSKGLQPNNIEIRRKVIDIASSLTIDQKNPNYETLLRQEKERFAVTNLRQGKGGKVEIGLGQNTEYRFTTIEMDLP